MKNSKVLFYFLALLLPVVNYSQDIKKEIKLSQLIDSINLNLNDNYVFPDKAQLIAKSLKAQLKKKVFSSTANDPQKLVKQLQAEIFKVHKDPHMVVDYNPGWQGHTQGYTGPSAEEITQFTKFVRDNNFMFKKVELLPGNIGYLPFTVFVEHVKEAKPIIASALGFLANSSAIIIDLFAPVRLKVSRKS